MNLHDAWTMEIEDPLRKEIGDPLRKQMLMDVKNIIIDDNLFKNFCRTKSICLMISGMNTGQRGDLYIQFIIDSGNGDLILKNTALIRKYESVGNPYSDICKFGNTSFRCSDSVIPPIFTLIKSKMCFGELPKDMNIIEIGCGYGINTVIWNDYLGFKSYTHVDLPEMLLLQEKYVSCFGVQNVRYLDPYINLDEINNSDFLISNYAFTELNHDIKLLYINKILKKCKRGIIIGKMIQQSKLLSNHLTGVHCDLLQELGFRYVFDINPVYQGGILYFERRDFENPSGADASQSDFENWINKNKYVNILVMVGMPRTLTDEFWNISKNMKCAILLLDSNNNKDISVYRHYLKKNHPDLLRNIKYIREPIYAEIYYGLNVEKYQEYAKRIVPI